MLYSTEAAPLKRCHTLSNWWTVSVIGVHKCSSCKSWHVTAWVNFTTAGDLAARAATPSSPVETGLSHACLHPPPAIAYVFLEQLCSVVGRRFPPNFGQLHLLQLKNREKKLALRHDANLGSALSQNEIHILTKRAVAKAGGYSGWVGKCRHSVPFSFSVEDNLDQTTTKMMVCWWSWSASHLQPPKGWDDMLAQWGSEDRVLRFDAEQIAIK